MLRPYPLKQFDQLGYEFITSQGIIYHIYFLDYDFVFSAYPEISRYIYTFNIDVVDGDEKNATSDERIGITVVAVFKAFFKNTENAVVYVCDTSDERHFARKCKFDYWFWRYNDGSILKEDGVAVIEGTEIVNALLIEKSNAKLVDIILAFKDLNDKAGEK